MSDLIDRQVAIDALGKEGLITAMIVVDNVPSTEPQRWIPCSERLPESGVPVLISHVGFVTEDFLDIDDGAMYFWNSGIDLDEELNNLAWMPLPEPWKGENYGEGKDSDLSS